MVIKKEIGLDSIVVENQDFIEKWRKLNYEICRRRYLFMPFMWMYV